MTCHSLQLLVAGVDYGIQVKVGAGGGWGRAGLFLGSSTGEGLGQLQAKPTQARTLGKEQDMSPAWAFHALALFAWTCVCTRVPTRLSSTMGREDGAAELWVCPTLWTWHWHREQPIYL